MKKRARESITPELTPLIDVVFLLLIFFMVSTIFKKNELALLMHLPKSSKDQTTSKGQLKTYTIELTDQSVAFNGTKTSLDNLIGFVSSIKKKSTPIEFRIDKNVKYNRIINVLNILKNNKLHNLALITDEK